MIKTKIVRSLPELKSQAQRAFNKYIKLRDSKRLCISCGKGPEQAGHYIAQGSSGALRYNEDNCHGQCVTCNLYMHGNLIEYRMGLVKRIGEKRVKYLEAHKHDIKKWTREELNELIKTYKSKTERG